MMKNYKLIIFFLIVALILAAIYFKLNPRKVLNLPFLNRKPVKLSIDFGENRQRFFEGPFAPNLTLYDVIRQSSVAGNFAVFYQELPDSSIIVSSIDNSYKETRGRWVFLLNNKEIQKPINKQFLAPGDIIESHFIRF